MVLQDGIMNSEDANGAPKSAADSEKKLRKALKEVELQAKRGEITPSEADYAAVALGGRPFAENLNDDSFDVFSIEFWPLAMALTWIIWRTNAATREVCPEYRSRRSEWRRHQVASSDGTLKTGWSVLKGQDGRPVAEDVSIEDVRMNFYGEDKPGRLRLPPSAFASKHIMSFDAARYSLWGNLQLGELPARGILNGERFEVTIRNLHWDNLVRADVPWGRPDDIAHDDDRDIPRYRSVRVPAQRVRELWPSQDSAAPGLTPGKPIDEQSATASTHIPALQTKVRELARRLWRDVGLPARVKDRDDQIIKEWPRAESPPDKKTIQRAFKNWTPHGIEVRTVHTCPVRDATNFEIFRSTPSALKRTA